MVSGMLNASLNNANIGDALFAGLSAGAMSLMGAGLAMGVGDVFGSTAKFLNELGRSMAHGSTQGIMRLAQGGKFEHGFLAGAVSSLGGSAMASTNAGGAAKIITSSAIGGTAEAIGGGKFANGAVTGAYTMLFNHITHPQNKPVNDPKSLDSVIEVQSRKELVNTARSLSEQYQVEIGAIEVEVNGQKKFYILPACGKLSGWEYLNTKTTSNFSSRYYPNGKVVATYHTHLSNNGSSRMDSYSAYRESGSDYVLNNRSVYLTEPKCMPRANGPYGSRVSSLSDWKKGIFTGINH
jgi:uncharacterized ParB-like nuclease family protein